MQIASTHELIVGTPAGAGGQPPIFAGDGRLYLDTVNAELNLWDVVVYHWPEVLGALLAIVILWTLVHVIRTWRKPLEPGNTYCRRCSYNLRGLSVGTTCPECGTDPHKCRPIRGAKLRRRVARPIAVGFLACAAYAAMYLAQIPRYNQAMGLFRWDAPQLMLWAQNNNLAGLVRHVMPERSLIEIDPVAGRIIRRVCRLARSSPITLTIAPDGKTAVTTLSRGDLAAIDLNTGRVVRTLRPTDALRNAPRARWRHVAGWLDHDTVCIQCMDSVTMRHEAYRWNISSGELRQIATIRMPTDELTKSVQDRLLYLIPATNPALAFEVPDNRLGGETYGFKSSIQIRNLADGGSVVREYYDEFRAQCPPLLIDGGSAFYVRAWEVPDILKYSTTDGSRLGVLKSPAFHGPSGRPAIAYNGATRRLFVMSTDYSIRVRDTVTDQWVARLRLSPGSSPIDGIAVSPDGRWVAINVEGSQRPIRHHLVIFDLLNAASTPDQP